MLTPVKARSCCWRRRELIFAFGFDALFLHPDLMQETLFSSSLIEPAVQAAD